MYCPSNSTSGNASYRHCHIHMKLSLFKVMNYSSLHERKKSETLKSPSGGDRYNGTVCRSKKEWRGIYGYGKISKTSKKKRKKIKMQNSVYFIIPPALISYYKSYQFPSIFLDATSRNSSSYTTRPHTDHTYNYYSMKGSKLMNKVNKWLKGQTWVLGLNST